MVRHIQELSVAMEWYRIIRKTDFIQHHHPEGVVCRSCCFHSSIVAVWKVTSRSRWWCIESPFPIIAYLCDRSQTNRTLQVVHAYLVPSHRMTAAAAAAVVEEEHGPLSTANLRTEILDFRGFDTSTSFLIVRGGIPRPIWTFPESLSQAILAEMITISR